jgi:rhodanese-related sulfurtransferase
MREVGDFVLLDVRTEAEYRQGHLPQAHLIPEAEVASRARAELPNKDTPVFVYCRSGVRSASAARTLAALGYTQVFDAGGILSWPRE